MSPRCELGILHNFFQSCLRSSSLYTTSLSLSPSLPRFPHPQLWLEKKSNSTNTLGNRVGASARIRSFALRRVWVRSFFSFSFFSSSSFFGKVPDKAAGSRLQKPASL
ncbi:hypothetical protein LX36DRAFT_289685 [Colletotrichum falcatum]|nr:hypothetical protein LX36DRAFT_289685 [Colletotrichum falcatum]